MAKNKKLSFLIVCILFAVLSGCAGFVDSVKSGAVGAVDYVKANAAVEKGDAAYDRGDLPRAFAYFKNAAELGHDYGQFMLANMYLSGEGTRRDKQAYVHWMERSAEGGYPPANYMMGVGIYSNNAQDAALAISYLEKAAQQEHDGAMHMLGLIWATGTGVKKNNAEALRWFRMAKAHGLPIEDRLLSEAGIARYVQELEKTPLRPLPDKRVTSATNRELVRDIQQGLTRLGYDPGPVDGLYGNKTKLAIQAFQGDVGMALDGGASEKVLELINKRKK